MSSTSPLLKSRKMKPARQRDNGAAAVAQRHGADLLRHVPGAHLAAGRGGSGNTSIEAVDEIEALFLDVPERAFAEGGLDVDQDFDAHRSSSSNGPALEGDLVAALELRISRASSGVATRGPAPR